MKENNVNSPETSSLRDKAKERLIERASENRASRFGQAEQNEREADLKKLNHELALHQIELELQNAALREALNKAETAISLYIRDRNFVEARIQEQKQFFEQVFSDSSVSTQILDKDGWCEKINPKLSELFGVKPEDIEGKKYNIFLDEALRREGILPILETVFKEGKTAEWDVFFDIGVAAASQDILVADKNKKRWFHNWAYPIFDQDGLLTHVVIQHTDSSEIKQTLLELIQAKEEAIQSDRLKSAFLANMSHEIRTPLNSIIGFSELMSEPDFDPAQQFQYSQIIFNSGNKLLSIISDIMDLSKIDAGEVQINQHSLSVSQVMIEIKKEYTFKAAAKDVELKLNLPVIEDVLIESDENKLRQVLINFVGNALKFTEKGFIEMGAQANSEFVQFHVKDTGIGIPAEFHAHIFERFRQVESADTRKYGGNGLGLTISKALVELLGGEVWLESGEGIGSTFYFTIPIKANMRP